MPTRQDIRRMVFITYPYVDRGQLSRLVTQYAGDRAPLDLDQVQRLAATNRAFLHWYAHLARQATQGRQFQEAAQTGQLNFADGTTLEKILEFLGIGVGGAVDIYGTWGDIQSAPYEAQGDIAIAQGQAALARAKEASTRYLVVGLVVVAAIVAAAVILNKRK